MQLHKIFIKDYYENDKERLREQARDKYRNLSEEEKNKKREYGRNRYHMSEKRKKKEKDLIFYGFNNICYVF